MLPADKQKNIPKLLVFLRSPKALFGVSIGMFVLLGLYVLVGTDLGDPTVPGEARFAPSGELQAPGLRNAAANTIPRRIADRLMSFGQGIGLVPASKETVGLAAKAAGADKGGAGAKGVDDFLNAGMEGLPGEVDEDGQAQAEAGEATAEMQEAAAAAAAAGGGVGQFQGGKGFGGNAGGAGGAGGAAMGSASPDGRGARASGIGASGPAGAAGRGGAPASNTQAASRAVVAGGVRRGGPGGPGTSMNALASGNASGSGGSRFASGGGGGSAVSAVGAAAGGTVGPGGSGAAIGAGMGGASGGGSGGGPGAGAPGTGSMDGGGDSGPGNDGRLEAYSSAVSSFETQEALARGRGYILCIIKAYKGRYQRAREQVNAMANSVSRAALYYESPPPGGFPSPPVASTLRNLHKNLVDEGGLRTQINNAAERLAQGEKCFPKDQDATAQALCYQLWGGPITGLKLLVDQIDAFYNLVGSEGAEAMKTLPCQSTYSYGYYGYNNCGAPRAFLDGEIKTYQSQLNAAKAEVNGLDWGNDDEVAKMSRSFAPQYAVAKMRLNDIVVAKLPRKAQPDWESVARNANLNLEKANTGWSQFEDQGSQQAKLTVFIEAHRDTQFAANELARGAAVLGLRPMPESGAPSAQFIAVQDVAPQECDLPPCQCGRPSRNPPCNACPPSDDKK